jgi:heme exporter protein D
MMNWASWNEFLSMGGYALYVWGSYLVCFAALAIESIVAFRAYKTALRGANRNGMTL